MKNTTALTDLDGSKITVRVARTLDTMVQVHDLTNDETIWITRPAFEQGKVEMVALYNWPVD